MHSTSSHHSADTSPPPHSGGDQYLEGMAEGSEDLEMVGKSKKRPRFGHGQWARNAMACTRCRRRKVKCDGKQPCSHCKEAHKSAAEAAEKAENGWKRVGRAGRPRLQLGPCVYEPVSAEEAASVRQKKAEAREEKEKASTVGSSSKTHTKLASSSKAGSSSKAASAFKETLPSKSALPSNADSSSNAASSSKGGSRQKVQSLQDVALTDELQFFTSPPPQTTSTSHSDRSPSPLRSMEPDLPVPVMVQPPMSSAARNALSYQKNFLMYPPSTPLQLPLSRPHSRTRTLNTSPVMPLNPGGRRRNATAPLRLRFSMVSFQNSWNVSHMRSTASGEFEDDDAPATRMKGGTVNLAAGAGVGDMMASMNLQPQVFDLRAPLLPTPGYTDDYHSPTATLIPKPAPTTFSLDQGASVRSGSSSSSSAGYSYDWPPHAGPYRQT
ncbi:hypothetical protein BT69DRAFT_1278512 [Atractiella rhizophila]|nr:hypothetical protein BT69DRAFT_1278512 [Atractiella rhizophila]